MQRVLVIDDEAHIRHMMRLTLEAAGYEVGEAADGLRGLEMCGPGGAWDVVLLDQKMPGIDGIETLRRLRECAPGTRVIMVTAFASIELAVEAMKLGATDFVRKPMTPDILRNTVAAALAKPPVAHSARAARALRPHIELSLLLFPATSDAPARGSAPKRPAPGGPKAAPNHTAEPEFDAEEADTDTYEGDEVVLDRFVREAILLESPTFPLCSEACEGIRPASESASGEGGAVTDPRLLPLLELAKRKNWKE